MAFNDQFNQGKCPRSALPLGLPAQSEKSSCQPVDLYQSLRPILQTNLKISPTIYWVEGRDINQGRIAGLNPGIGLIPVAVTPSSTGRFLFSH
jgi:hypothetical protein